MKVFCSVFVEDKLKNLNLICSYYMYLCLQIRSDSNAILLQMTRVSGQKVGEDGNCRERPLLGWVLPPPTRLRKTSWRKVPNHLLNSAALLSRHVCSHNKKNSLFHYQIQTSELFDIIFGFSIIQFKPVFFSKVPLRETFVTETWFPWINLFFFRTEST